MTGGASHALYRLSVGDRIDPSFIMEKKERVIGVLPGVPFERGRDGRLAREYERTGRAKGRVRVSCWLEHDWSRASSEAGNQYGPRDIYTYIVLPTRAFTKARREGDTNGSAIAETSSDTWARFLLRASGRARLRSCWRVEEAESVRIPSSDHVVGHTAVT